MRIGPHTLVQMVGDQLVVMDDRVGSEVVLDRETVLGMCQAISYFAPHLGLLTERPNGADVESVELKMPWMQFTLLCEVLDAFVARAPDSNSGVIVRKNAIRSLKFEFRLKKKG